MLVRRSQRHVSRRSSLERDGADPERIRALEFDERHFCLRLTFESNISRQVRFVSSMLKSLLPLYLLDFVFVFLMRWTKR